MLPAKFPAKFDIEKSQKPFPFCFKLIQKLGMDYFPSDFSSLNVSWKKLQPKDTIDQKQSTLCKQRQLLLIGYCPVGSKWHIDSRARI